jgi:hypothetical protein
MCVFSICVPSNDIHWSYINTKWTSIFLWPTHELLYYDNALKFFFVIAVWFEFIWESYFVFVITWLKNLFCIIRIVEHSLHFLLYLPTSLQIT